MSFLEERFLTTDLYGKVHRLTPKQILRRVRRFDGTDCNITWIKFVKQAVRACQNPRFPEAYALKIKTSILNKYAYFIYCSNREGNRLYFSPLELEVTKYCYHSLFFIENEEAKFARKHFLIEMLTNYTQNLLYHPGPTFWRLREDFIYSKFYEYYPQENIDFEKMNNEVFNTFFDFVKNAEVNGSFEKDEESDRRLWEIYHKNNL